MRPSEFFKIILGVALIWVIRLACPYVSPTVIAWGCLIIQLIGSFLAVITLCFLLGILLHHDWTGCESTTNGLGSTNCEGNFWTQ